MPTLSPEPHQAREVAESFGVDADRYHRARPTYPQEAIEAILRSAPGGRVLDVGSGTGIATGQFATAGAEVLGVEVDVRMAAVAQAAGQTVEVSPFEEWDPAGRRFDAVVSAQSWHWIDPVAGAQKAAEALVDGGRLAVLWNVFEPPDALAAAWAKVYRETVKGLPFIPWEKPALDPYEAILTKVAAGLESTGAFTPPEESRYAWHRVYTRDEWLDQLPTHGGHTRMPAAQLEAVLRGIGETIEEGFTMNFTTVVMSATRLPRG